MNQVATLAQHEPIDAGRLSRSPTTGIKRYWEVGEHAQLLAEMESFLSSVLETQQIPFDIRQQHGRFQIVRNPVGVSRYRNLSGFLTRCGAFMDIYRPDDSYRADLQLFFDCFQQHPLAKAFGYGVAKGAGDDVRAASLYNDFVNLLRGEAIRLKVKKRLSDARANLWDQETSIRRYLHCLHAHYRLLVPVRMDLFYAESAADEVDAMERTSWNVSHDGIGWPVPSMAMVGHGRAETRARIDTSVAMADRDRFFENQRGVDRAVFRHLVGYICKLEQGGKHRANHFHCIFLFAGQGLTKANTWELKHNIAERWRAVTRGQGLAYDCHARPDRAEIRARGAWAIDPVNNADHERVAVFIDYVARYFAKDDDQMIRIKPTARARALTMGHLSMY